MTLYVGNLPFDASGDDLAALFARFGRVTGARVAIDRDTGRPHGFGYVALADGGPAAVAGANGAVYRGRVLAVSEAGPPWLKADRRA